MIQTAETKTLMMALANYGLNPNEWDLQPQSQGLYSIQSKQDQDFVFTGKIKKQGRELQWEKIELVSL